MRKQYCSPVQGRGLEIGFRITRGYLWYDLWEQICEDFYDEYWFVVEESIEKQRYLK